MPKRDNYRVMRSDLVDILADEMASQFDRNKLTLRRFEVQMLYHAAYLYWGLRGLLAERWGHGPYFSAYGTSEDELRLTRLPGIASDLVALVGLRRSAFIAEGDSVAEGRALARSWLDDVLTTLSPVRVTRVLVRNLYAYPVSDPARMSQAMIKYFPGLDGFVPKGLGTRHGGLQYQIVDEAEDMTVRRSVTFGVYGPSQQSEYFNLVDSEWHLGFHHLADWISEDGLDNPSHLLDEAIGTASDEAWEHARTQIARVASHG